MIIFLAVAAFALSAWLLLDLVTGVRRSRDTQQDRWQRAMTALSTPAPVRAPAPTQRQSSAIESDTRQYEPAA